MNPRKEPARVYPNGDHCPKAAAARLHKSEQTLAIWRSKGIGPNYRRIGGRIFYPAASLEAFETAAEVQVQEAA